MRALFLTEPGMIQSYWPEVERCIQPVIDQAARGEFLTEDIKRLCDERRAFCAVVMDGEKVIMAVAFEFIFYPRMTACNIMALGGERLNEVANTFFITFKTWLYGMGVTVIEASCSSAMSRLLKPIGFEKTYEVVRYEVRLP